MVDQYGENLATAIEEALPRWVVRSVNQVTGDSGKEPWPELIEAAQRAGDAAVGDVGPAVRRLLAQDIDAQETTPLSLLRGAVKYPTAVLIEAGVPPRDRDEYSIRQFPDDPYDLMPANFSDIDESLSEPGFAWGASKAFAHKNRHGGPK